MKRKTLTNLRLGLLLCLLSTLPFLGKAQLSGSYTLNPNSSASGTNYQNWASVVNDLVSGSRTDNGTAQGPGVSGPVTITVYDTVYATQIAIAAISGTSASNTITFKSAGGDSSQCVLRYPSGSSATGDYVLSLNGADFVTFQNIGFERTGTQDYSTVIEIGNDADNNRLLNCLMIGKKMPSNSSSGFVYGIGSIVYFTGNGDSNLLMNNKMIYGYNGIYGTQTCAGNKIYSNVIDTSGSSGIYLSGQSSLEIIGNTFNMGDFGPNQGHYVSYGMRIENAPGMLISKNKVYMFARNGQVVRAIMLANTTSTSTLPARINNNWVYNEGGTGDCTGLAVYNCFYVDFFYNNILITNSLANGSVYYHYSQYSNSNIRIVNNNLINKGTGYVYNVPGTNTADLTTVDYNNCYTNGNKFANWSGTDYTSFSAWKSASGKDGNSLNTDPGFISNYDLHVSNISLNGSATPYTFVDDDIDDQLRDTLNPDIGADEFFPAQTDAGISNLDSPLRFCPGTNVVKATFQNYGIDTISSVILRWSINGVGQDSVAWTGKLSPGSSSSSITLGNYTFSSNTPYLVKVWTDQPNSSSDGKTINDTITITRYAGVTGTYTIGDTASADYKSFNDAITDMTARGICGPTTFSVYDGIYTEQITLVELPGMGALNPVTFQSISQDSSKVIVTHASTTATGNNNATIQLRGADHTTFKGITFQRTGANPFALVVHILNGSHNNEFANCRMIATTSTTLDAVNVYSNLGLDTGNTFRNNHFIGGPYNLYYMGTATDHETGTLLEGNVFDSATTSAVYLGYNDGVVVRGNLFKNIRYTNILNSFDLQLFECDSAIRITGNYFLDQRSETAIHDSMCTATAAKPGIIANNFIAKTNGIGVKINGVANHTLVFNSIYFSGSDINNAAIKSTNSTTSNIVLRNNNVVMEQGYLFYFYSTGHLGSSNYNNWLANGTRLLYYGNNYTSFGAYRSNSGYDGNSVQMDPLFVSATNLHMKNPQMKGLGTPYQGISTDIDGETRNSTTPDIGADEFELVKDDAGIVALVSPGNGVCEGDIPITAVIKNYGSAVLDSATIEWSMNGVSQPPFSWTGSLATNATDTVTLAIKNFTGASSPYFILKTTMPNGNIDGIDLNDSILVFRAINGIPQAAAGNDSSICIGDSVLLGAPGVSGTQYVWYNSLNSVIDSAAQIKVSPTAQSTYYLDVVTLSSGCSNRDTVTINVNSRPTANAGSDRAICPNTAVQIGTASQTGMGYSWTSNPPVFVSTSAQPTVAPDTTITYYLKQTNTSSGCFDLDSVTVTVHPLPTPQIQGDNKVCVNSATSFKTPGSSGATYFWTVTGGNIQSGQADSTVVVKWGSAGAGRLIVYERSSNNCNNSDTFDLTIFNNPVAKMGIEGMCAVAPVKFTDSSANASSRIWSFGDGQTSTDSSATHSYSNKGNFLVQLRITDVNGCVDSVRQNRAIEDAPTPDFTTSTPLCEDENVTFNNSTAGTADSWEWDFGNGQTSIQQNPVQVFANAGDFDVMLIAGDMGCTDTITKTITVNAKPSAGFNATVSGQTVTFVPDDTTGATYQWTFGDGQTSIDKRPVHWYNTGEKWVTVTLTITSAEGCSGSITDSVYVQTSSISERLPAALVTLNISPNPFRNLTTMDLELAKRGHLLVKFFDMSGKEIATLADGYENTGKVQVKIDAAELKLKAGVYFTLIKLDGEPVTRQVIKVE